VSLGRLCELVIEITFLEGAPLTAGHLLFVLKQQYCTSVAHSNENEEHAKPIIDTAALCKKKVTSKKKA